MRRLALLSSLLFSLACRDGGSGASAPAPSAPAAPAPTPTAWPPPGAKAAPPPPEVLRIMQRVAEGLSTHNAAEVERYFITDMTFGAVSDCDAGVADQVAQGRKEAGARANRSESTRFGEFTEGYLLEVAAGGKPGPCRARQAVGLYQGRYRWDVAGKAETGEAHFLRVGTIWFLVKL